MKPLFRFIFAFCLITNYVAWRWALDRVFWIQIRKRARASLLKGLKGENRHG